MKDRGLRFRSHIVSGPGGRQIQLLDPDENAIELFEPASRS
jgi:glyoxylase I family protein